MSCIHKSSCCLHLLTLKKTLMIKNVPIKCPHMVMNDDDGNFNAHNILDTQ